MIFTGVDLVKITRFSKMTDKTAFIKKICTPSESEIINNSKRGDEKLAAIFSLKEAFAKALGTGIGSKLSFSDIEVSYTDVGQPKIKYKGDKFKKSSEWQVSCSVTHDDDYLVSMVVLLGDLQ